MNTEFIGQGVQSPVRLFNVTKYKLFYFFHKLQNTTS
jgi:hypothetical protein